MRSASGGPPWLARTAIAGLALLLVVGCVAASVLVLARQDSSESAGAHAVTPRTTSLSRSGAAAPAAREPLLRELRAALAMEGIAVRWSGATALVVTFDDGLFARAGELTTGVRGLLTRVGRRLKPFAGGVTVEVVGLTDGTAGGAGPSKTNEQLRVARADAVQATIRAPAGLPASMLSSGVGRDIRSPYSNKTDDGQRRNRTAVLVITAKRP